VSRVRIATIAVVALVAATIAGARAQEMAPPPQLGAVILEDPLTSAGVFPAASCPSGRSSARFGPDGLRLSVAGRCNDADQFSNIVVMSQNVTVPDGEIRFEAQPEAGTDRVELLILGRQPEQFGGYGLHWVPASGNVQIRRYGSGPTQALAQRAGVASVSAPGERHALALRFQGSRIWALVDDQPVLMATDETFSAGRVALALTRTGPNEDTDEVSLLLRSLRISGLAGSPPDRLPTVRGAAQPTQPAAPAAPASAPVQAPIQIPSSR
jgi:hypothetical protein